MKSLTGTFTSARGWVLLIALLFGAGLMISGCGEDNVPTPSTPEPTTPASPPPTPDPEPTSPAAPEDLGVTASGSDFIEWGWTPVEDVSGYDVQFSTNEAFTAAAETIARTAEEISYRRENLEAETSYFLRVRSVAGAAEERLESAWTTQVTGMTTAAGSVAPPAAARTSFGAGTWLVNDEIALGRYFTNPSDGCYWERLSGTGGTFGEILANGSIGFDSAQEIVDVLGSDYAFKPDSDCGRWRQSAAASAPAGMIPPGRWLVGQQIQPGQYETNASDGCYWERLRSFTGEVSRDVIANDFLDENARQIITIGSSDTGFYTDSDCGTWTLLGSQSTASPAAPDIGTIERNRRRYDAHQGVPGRP